MAQRRLARSTLVAVLLWRAGTAAARTPPADDRDGEHGAVLEVGAAVSAGGSQGTRLGGSIAAEKTVVEDWLEVELGISAVTGHGGETEIGGSLLFKKPWQLTRRLELMIGLGPELVHAVSGSRGTSPGMIAVVDLMFWPRRNFGWYVEPGYEVVFRHGSKGGFTATGGLLIGF